MKVYIERIGDSTKYAGKWELQPCVLYNADDLELKKIRVCAVKDALKMIKDNGWESIG